ncbi:MAG TPA: hypothetical protein VKR59_18130 [Terriglobales bacterium]|nr:hypothetical protein [Terriglobales bacterium]
MEIQDLAQEYQAKTDEELLRLALDSADLTPEANLVLTTELSRRGIKTEDRLVSFRAEEQRRKEEASKHTGSLFIIHPFGIGHLRFGKADRVYDPATGLERFKTTIFIVLFWLPLIPTGTFFIEKKRSQFFGKLRILKRLPLDWRQVRRVWGVAIGIVLSMIITIIASAIFVHYFL